MEEPGQFCPVTEIAFEDLPVAQNEVETFCRDMYVDGKILRF
jgi:hypothetical protein